MKEAALQRLEKFRRILPRLDLAPAEPGGPITVIIDPPIDELCEVTLRLTHANGRTYAQREVMLSPETDRIPLSPTRNLPEGDYDVIVTPPLAEYYSTSRIEHRIPISIATAPTRQSDIRPAP
ncbi:hypothetical protein VE25_13410 [Devosia geojensis]|uniref:Uncharacterized protein n=1 Tax=Devosia geojensis TaxID=443610 RepID=A0A0F5FR49_9HYPH|nr:hypothetical protein [Devosia geojensis]KKB11308.1 hypothetical protein VE25_13410 [Devosia geojensis]